MIKSCYGPAGGNLNKSSACSILEKDLLNLLWKEYDFPTVLEMNKIKYIYEYANMQPELFEEIKDHLKEVYKNYSELLEELYNHRDLVILRVKKLVDHRIKNIMKQAEEDKLNPTPTIYKHEITIEEQVDKGNLPNYQNFPRPTSPVTDKLFEEH